ncbi:PREDICTED: centromere protein J [Ceratosolen solmsi marchali]|uniref:Centromere protein J n=1 Tax=Ceratosolen solmsi marchali TaxID=326594 RepID=A0AAJ6YKT4_9HYME|nr:PREDICTED: centromere protein J [Ceratosolen solmsi marchali]
MAIEATIVEQLQELQKWQTQRKEELIKQQQKQREQLSNEQNRIYHSLSLSVEEMNLNDQSLKELIGQDKEEIISDLIDFNTPDEQCESQRNNFSHYVTLTNEKNNKLNLKEPQVQLNVKNKNFNLESNLECNNSYNPDSYNSQYSIDSTQSYSSRMSDRQRILLDDIPVPSPKKDFNTLLEERLKDDEGANIKNKNKPVFKRPFLKKGQGLARFMPNSNSGGTGRPRSASLSIATQSNNNKASRATKLERCNSLPRSKQTDASKKLNANSVSISQPKLTIKNVPPPRKKTRGKPIGSMLNSIVDKKNPVEIISDTNSSDLEIKNKRELDEVRIFEFLEDKAENSSFCSTSSTVIAFLQQSTPLKHKALLHSASKHKISLHDIGDKTLEKIACAAKASHLETPQSKENIKDQKHIHWDKVPISKMKEDKTVTGTILPYGTDIDEQYDDYVMNQDLSEDENSVSLHVRFSEHNEYKTMTDASSVSSDSETIINYTDNKGTWSDSSVTPDSSDMESIISLQLKPDAKCNDNNKISPNFIKEIEDNSYDDDIDFKNEVENEEENENEIEQKNVTLQNDDTVIEEKNENTSLFKSQLLKTRLLELEQEIEIFRKESAALTFQKQKLQEERTKLHEEHTNILRIMKEKEETLEMEKRKTETILQEEKKRLTREKLALENRMKDAWEKAQKSKQERQEIQTLKDQLEDLKEEYDQKESKWSATSARQRSQIRVLQTENSKLKQELEKIQQKKNAKLKKPTTTTNTRAINHINKVLGDRKKEELKNSNNIGNYDMGLEEKQQEKDIEKVKILKTAESIARTRNLYESLLKDATEDFPEIKIGKRNLIDKYVKSDKKTEDYLNYEENNYDCQIIEDDMYPINAASPKLLQEMQEESNKFNDERNNKVERAQCTDNKQGIREVNHPDGHIEYWYPNGNVKKVFPDKFLTKIIYYNGDVSETDKNGNVKYFYASLRTWHTTMSDGLEILEFPDGQVERKSKNGTIEVSFPDGSVKIVQTDGSEKWALRDGTIAETSADGEKILILPNGQREIHTKEHKRREYLDGTVKLIYPNGIQETRYANGRIRLKDKDGNLIMDNH